jgi:protein arginine N-methyltransferase 7
MYQGLNKGGGGIIGWGGSGEDLRVLADEAFEGSSGVEGVMCEDPEHPGQMIVAVARLAHDGALKWIRGDMEREMKRTVAMSQMTSMLRDHSRNACYSAAIKILIENFNRIAGRPPVALDIGTGTGLLAMLSARHGAAHVFACEMFDAMASIAQGNTIENYMIEEVTVIPCKSSDISELPNAPDILVSELLDSSLLGEAVIPAHADAISRLLNSNIDSAKLPITDRIVPNR